MKHKFSNVARPARDTALVCFDLCEPADVSRYARCSTLVSQNNRYVAIEMRCLPSIQAV